MGGGLMQLVAYGAQDIYLTGNPQITFFKVVYRRHTNFSMESIEQTFNGTADFGKKVSATISRNGDLISSMHLDVKIAGGSLTAEDLALYGTDKGVLDYIGYCENTGHAYLKDVRIDSSSSTDPSVVDSDDNLPWVTLDFVHKP